MEGAQSVIQGMREGSGHGGGPRAPLTEPEGLRKGPRTVARS